MHIENENDKFRGGSTFQRRTGVGMSAANNDSSDFNDFLLLRPWFSILCASAIVKGSCGRDVYGCAGQAEERDPTHLRRLPRRDLSAPPA